MSVSPLEDWTEAEILWTIGTQFGYADDFIRKKKIWWSQYAKLYVNQYRKENQADSLGSKLLFTKFNETYSSFATDEVQVEFQSRTLDDFEKVANANKIKDYDWDEFNGPGVWNEWLWDALFYGIGILDVSNYDKKRKLLLPSTQNPFIFWFDPMAADEITARFCGRFIYSDYYSLLNDSRLDGEKVKQMGRDGFSTPNQQESQLLYQDTKTVLMGTQYFTEPVMPNGYFEVLNWYLKVAGKTYEVFTDNQRRILLGWQELKYKDNENLTDLPFVVRRFYKVPRQFLGIGIPDIVEDDHRADVRLMNYMFAGIKQDSTPSFLFNYKALLNPKDLTTREMGKNVPFIQSPGNEIVPFPKTNVVSSDTIAFLNMIQNRSDSAIGSSKILRGSLASVKKSATEVAVAKAKQDLMNASRSKDMTDSEKRFWYIWLNRNKRFIGPKDEKAIRIIGKRGSEEYLNIKGKDFIPKIDPDIKVVSKLISEPTKVLMRRDMGELLQPIAQAGGNMREAIRQLLYLIDKRKEDIDNLLPPTPHELRAYEENHLIKEEKIALIHENDDDLQHIAIHQRAEDGKMKDIHIQAHVYNFLRKQGLPEAGKEEAEQTGQPAGTPAGMPMSGQQGQPPAIGKEIPQEGMPIKGQRSVMAGLGGMLPKTSATVK